MKVVKEYWQCDICGAQFKQDHNLAKLKIPSRSYDCEGKGWTKSFKSLDLCEGCLDKLWEICDEKFATVKDCYGIVVIKHFSKD